MNTLVKTALIPAALALTLTAALGTASAQTTTQARPNVLFLVETGRPGAVDVYVDGTQVEAGVQATDRPSALFLTPGTHEILVKTSLSGAVVAQASVKVVPNSPNAISLQNNDDTSGGRTGPYTLAFASGSTAVKNLLKSD